MVRSFLGIITRISQPRGVSKKIVAPRALDTVERAKTSSAFEVWIGDYRRRLDQLSRASVAEPPSNKIALR